MHFDAKVGHIGGNLSCIDILALLHTEILASDDRFVLSKGHAAGALYIALWATGRLSDDDLATFHGNGTILAGHPPPAGIDGITFATGSLGHGASLAAGLALSARLRGRRRRVFCLMSDGDLQEGSTWEALAFSGHHRLAELTLIVDKNDLQGMGTTAEICSAGNLADRCGSFGFEIRECNGHDLDQLRAALAPSSSERPMLIIAQTTKGRGVSFMENDFQWHYLPLSEEQFAQSMRELSRDNQQ